MNRAKTLAIVAATIVAISSGVALGQGYYNQSTGPGGGLSTGPGGGLSTGPGGGLSTGPGGGLSTGPGGGLSTGPGGGLSTGLEVGCQRAPVVDFQPVLAEGVRLVRPANVLMADMCSSAGASIIV
jgi:hypothetical protein